MGAVGALNPALQELQAAWPELHTKISAAQQQGKDPQEPEVKSWATRLLELIQNATGKNITHEDHLQGLLRQYGPVLKQYVGDKLPNEGFISYVAKAAGLASQAG